MGLFVPLLLTERAATHTVIERLLEARHILPLARSPKTGHFHFHQPPRMTLEERMEVPINLWGGLSLQQNRSEHRSSPLQNRAVSCWASFQQDLSSAIQRAESVFKKLSVKEDSKERKGGRNPNCGQFLEKVISRKGEMPVFGFGFAFAQVCHFSMFFFLITRVKAPAEARVPPVAFLRRNALPSKPFDVQTSFFYHELLEE